jgi:murein L,D-transpeptidase YcbB/YkuD
MATTCTIIQKSVQSVLILLLCTTVLTFQGCKKKRSDIADALYKKTRNNVFKKLTHEGYDSVFLKVLNDEKSKLSNAQLISDFYDQHDNDPVFLMGHLQNDDLKTLTGYFDKANEHGLDSNMFRVKEFRQLVAKFYDPKAIKTVDEAYADMARLELLTANSLINYSNDLQYGAINPKKVYSRYFMATKEADSASMAKVFYINNFKTYLDSIQPKNPQYIALQKALAGGEPFSGLTKEETRRVLMVNLERLRWQNKPTENKYVIVNVADYQLDVMDSGISVLNMKVCVGQGRNMDNAKTLVRFDDTDKVDRPFIHETPLLNSKIHSVQVNPVWNIPESIANKEIIVEAAKDPYYLSNKSIDVYKDGEKIDDTESIDWSTVDKSQYEFKQEPGADNSLGKIKFLFNNKSNVYLHDTPAKEAFYHSMRAVSHGCVRLGNPQGLALALFGEGDDYDKITKDMAEDNPDPTTIDLPKKTAVYITYSTCWADKNGILQYRPDVYGLDIVLYAHLNAQGIN